MSEPKILKEKISSLQQIWKSQSQEYINTYPDAKLGTNTTLNRRSFDNLVDTYSKMISFDAQLHGLSDGVNVNLEKWDNKLVSLKNAIGNNKQGLINEYSTNNASSRLKQINIILIVKVILQHLFTYYHYQQLLFLYINN